MGYHPHGICSLGAWGNFATEGTGFSKTFPGITNSLLTLTSNFRIPLYRDYLLFHGVHSVSRRSCENILRRGPGSAITIVVGGAEESLIARPNSLDLVLKKRLGFIKMAIRTGSSLVPILSFGEADIFEQLDNEPTSKLFKMQQFVKRCCGFTIPLIHARGIFNYNFGLIPYRRPINTVVGKPIHTKYNPEPEMAEVKIIQAEYIAELKRMWDEHKNKYATHRKHELRLVE